MNDFLNQYRVFPRLQLAFWGVLVYRITEWAMMQGPELTNAQAAIVSTVYLAGAGYGKIYGDTDPSNKPVVAVSHE